MPKHIKTNYQKYFLLALFTLFLLGCQQKTNIDTYDSKGNTVRLSDYRGKWVIINFWATWCSPCLTELPELNKLYQKYNDKLVVLGVNFDQLANTDIQAFAQKQALHFPLLSQFPLNKLGIKNVQTLPMTVVINQQGKVIQILHGPQTEKTLTKILQLGS